MVVSPKNLWADYNRSEMPLDVTEICTFETPFGKEKHVYFNGETTAVGCTRIYARALLSSCNNDKIVIVMLSPEQDISSTDFLPLLEKGWSVLIPMFFLLRITIRLYYTNLLPHRKNRVNMFGRPFVCVLLHLPKAKDFPALLF